MADVGAANRRGELRTAIEGLLRTCADLDHQSAHAASDARSEANAIATALGGLRLPGMGDLADEIAAIGTKMDADLTAQLADARRPYVEEAHELLALLAPIHGVPDALPPLDAAASIPTTIVGHFPPGFAQTYVRDILGSVHDSITLATDEADHAGKIPADDAANAKEETRPAYSEPHQAEGIAMLKDPKCHAVERHGPHIPDQAQLARLIWRKDFTGEYAWQIMPDGTVTSDHNVGIATGGFTSPEAMAKPIDAFLRHAHEKHENWNEFLDSKTKAKRINIHISAEHAGLVADDVSGYRGAATRTREARDDWLAARQHAMDTASTPVYAIPFNPVEVGSDPGALLIFKRTKAGWHLVTCFPVDEPRPDSKRLENLT